MNIAKFIENNLRSLAIAFGAILLIVVAVAGFGEIKKSKENKAQSEMWEAKKNFERLIAENKIEDGIASLNPVVKKYQGSQAAFDALLSVGDYFNKQKNHAKALEYYSQASNEAPDKFSKTLALYSKAISLEQNGQFVEALQNYLDAKNIKTNIALEPELLMGMARCQEKLGNNQAAANFYKEIKEKFANKSFYNNSATAFLSRIEKIAPSTQKN